MLNSQQEKLMIVQLKFFQVHDGAKASSRKCNLNTSLYLGSGSGAVRRCWAMVQPGDQKGNYYVLYGDTAVREARNIKSLLMWSNLKDIMLSNINQGTQTERLHNVT